MGEQRLLVYGVDSVCGRADRLRDIAQLHGDDAVQRSRLLHLRDKIGAGKICVRSIVPGNLQSGETLARRAIMVGDHGDEVIELYDLPHAFHRLGLAVVDAFELAAEDRARRERREFQARQQGVDAEFGRAVHLRRRIGALRGRSDQLEILRILQRDFIGGRIGRRLVGERAIGELAA